MPGPFSSFYTGISILPVATGGGDWGGENSVLPGSGHAGDGRSEPGRGAGVNPDSGRL